MFQQKTPGGLSLDTFGSYDISEPVTVVRKGGKGILTAEPRSYAPAVKWTGGGGKVIDSLKGNKGEMGAEWAKSADSHCMPRALGGPGVASLLLRGSIHSAGIY